MIETLFVKINDDGIYLKHDFEWDLHIDFAEVDAVVIRKGFVVKHWILLLLLGLVISYASLLSVIESIQKFDSSFITSSGVRLYLLLQIVPWILFIFGLVLIYFSLRRGAILEIYTEYGRHKVSIKEIEKEMKVGDVVQFLNERVKVTVDKKIQIKNDY